MLKVFVSTFSGVLLPLLLSALCGVTPAQTRRDACESSPAARRALNALLPNLNDFRVPRAERLKPLRALAEKYPRDRYAESYVKEHNYSFPVIASKDLTEQIFPVLDLPQGWIIDAQGRRSSYTRLSTAERMPAELEKAARH